MNECTGTAHDSKKATRPTISLLLIGLPALLVQKLFQEHLELNTDTMGDKATEITAQLNDQGTCVPQSRETISVAAAVAPILLSCKDAFDLRRLTPPTQALPRVTAQRLL
jgi:hypothetical protein